MSFFNKENLQKLGRAASVLNSGIQAVTAAQQVYQAVNGTGTQNGTTNQQLQPSQREITFVQPNAAEKGDKNKSLFGEFNEEFLKKNISLINQHRPSDGFTPLICAVLRKCLDSVVLLLSNGTTAPSTTGQFILFLLTDQSIFKWSRIYQECVSFAGFCLLFFSSFGLCLLGLSYNKARISFKFLSKNFLFQASVNATDSKGNTALHYADTPLIVKALIIFRADLNIKNKAGADCFSGRKRQEITQILLKAKLWDELKIIENATTTTTSPSLQTKINEHKQQIAVQCQFRKDLEDKKRSLRLLSLDGGGIKGLVLIQILMELEDICGNTENFVTKNFDWIAGTSTGAILALALADGYKPIQCLRLYLRLKDEIFLTRSNPLVPYPDEKIEKFLKENFGENRKMANIKNKKLKVFVTATKADQIPIKMILYRSYDTPLKKPIDPLPQNVNIWKAARCSSAAPTFFSSVNGVMDGGLMANNPGVTLLLEVFKNIDFQALSDKNENPPPDLAFMLSLGTGKSPEVAVPIPEFSPELGLQGIIQTVQSLNNLKSILVEQLSTSDGQVVEIARYMSHTRRVPYFRLTPSLNTDIQLDTVDNTLLIEMLWTTKEYIREKCSTDVLSLLELFSAFNRGNE
ncbi:unnamed protein product [Meloidogyne enterolobii]|uniref:Uncharacterized protein n=1 Tax=Meloidogyne enterolobii TaxID=390850 RepID=A0ACB0XUE2_MELEN